MKRLDRKGAVPAAAPPSSLQTNGNLLPPGPNDVASPISAVAERASPFANPPSRRPQHIIQHRYNNLSQADYKNDHELDVLAEAADAMPSHPPHSQHPASSALLYAKRGSIGSSTHRHLQPEPDRDVDILRTRQKSHHGVSPLSASTVTAGSGGMADADGDPDGDASVDGDEADELIDEWAGSSYSRPTRGRDHGRERERQRERERSITNGGVGHRGIPLSDVRSSGAPTPRKSDGSVTPVAPGQIPLGGASYDAQPHPAKRIKVEDGLGGDSDVGNSKIRKDKPRKRTPSFSPSPSPSPRSSHAPSQNTPKTEVTSPVMARTTVTHTSSTVISTSSERASSNGTLPGTSTSDDGSTAVEHCAPIPGSASTTSQSRTHTASSTASDSQPSGNLHTAPQEGRTVHPNKRPSLQAMDEDSPDADDFKSSTFPPTPTATLSSSILGKRPRRASIDDELLATATGHQELSSDEMLERAAFYDGRSQSSSRSRSRSSSPIRMQRGSSLRVVTGGARE